MVTATANLYIGNMPILTDRIKEFNEKFIPDKSGLRLAGVLQFILQIVKYAPLEGRGWKPLPEFLSKKEAIINIKNNDERCFGYALLYFLERANLPEKNSRLRIFTRMKCFSDIILTPILIQFHPIMSICTKINFRLYQCFTSLMTKVALAIPLWSVARRTNGMQLFFTERNIMHQLIASRYCF